jgi:hypothetical protein
VSPDPGIHALPLPPPFPVGGRSRLPLLHLRGLLPPPGGERGQVKSGIRRIMSETLTSFLPCRRSPSSLLGMAASSSNLNFSYCINKIKFIDDVGSWDPPPNPIFTSRLNIPLFLGFVGLFSMLLMWPGFFIAHVSQCQ